MKEVWVVAGGSCSAEQLAREGCGDEYIICADSGAEVVMAAGLTPRMLVGDFDSLDPRMLARLRMTGVTVLEFPVKKDASDVELALEQAILLRPEQLILWGGWGSRWDHSLVNVHLLAGLAKAHSKMGIKMVDTHNVLRFVSKRYDWKGPVGSPVSLLPYSRWVEGVTSRGLYYPLKDQTLKRESSLGISNRTCEECSGIEVREGLLMLMQSYDDVVVGR